MPHAISPNIDLDEMFFEDWCLTCPNILVLNKRDDLEYLTIEEDTIEVEIRH